MFMFPLENLARKGLKIGHQDSSLGNGDLPYWNLSSCMHWGMHNMSANL